MLLIKLIKFRNLFKLVKKIFKFTKTVTRLFGKFRKQRVKYYKINKLSTIVRPPKYMY